MRYFIEYHIFSESRSQFRWKGVRCPFSSMFVFSLTYRNSLHLVLACFILLENHVSFNKLYKLYVRIINFVSVMFRSDEIRFYGRSDFLFIIYINGNTSSDRFIYRSASLRSCLCHFCITLFISLLLIIACRFSSITLV